MSDEVPTEGYTAEIFPADVPTARKLLTVEERITRIFRRIEHVQKQNDCEKLEAALAVVLREMIELQDQFDDLKDLYNEHLKGEAPGSLEP